MTDFTYWRGSKRRPRKKRNVSGEMLDLLEAADKLIDEGNIQEAEEVHFRIVEKFPKNAQAYFERAYCRFTRGGYKEAIADCTTALQLDRRYAEAFQLRGEAHDELKSYTEALRDLSQAIALKPNEPSFFFTRGTIREHAQNYVEAVEDFGRCIKLNPENGYAYSHRADLRKELGDEEGARSDYASVLTVFKPTHSSDFLIRGEANEALGKLSEALQEYSSGLQLEPEEPALYLRRGFVKHRMKDHEGAILDYDRVLEKGTDQQVTLLSIRGMAKYECGQFEESLSDLSQALDLDDQNSAIRLHRGYVLQKLKRPSEAIADYTRVLELRGSCPETYLRRAEIRLEQGEEPAGPIGDLKRALESAPEDWAHRKRVLDLLRNYDPQ